MNTLAASASDAPFISIVTPVYDPPVDVLDKTIASVRAQTYRNWELILVDDLSPNPRVRETLRAAASKDPRIVVVEREVNGHIVAASNDGVARARGEFIALLDHDDVLLERALELMVRAVQANPHADYLYSDEAKVTLDGHVFDVFRKPDWSPERFRGQMYTGHLSLLRTSLVRHVGGFHEGFEGSQDHDLVLRVTEQAREVHHVPHVLYHWRAVAGSTAGGGDAKPYAWDAGCRAVQAHMDRLGIDGTVHKGVEFGTYVIDRKARVNGLVSVVIPTRGSSGSVWGEQRTYVVEAVRSLLANAGPIDLEVVVVHDTETPSMVLDALHALAGDRLVLVPYDKPFNYSEKCNLGVIASHGQWIVLLNDDIEIVSSDFVQQLTAPLLERGVGMTAPRLLFPDNTIQHAGVLYRHRSPYHAYYSAPDEALGHKRALTINRECSALSGACLAIRRSDFLAVGGLNEALPGNYNDVDFSLKIAARGLRLVWLAHARAYHFESKTRVPVVHPWELKILNSRWQSPDVDRYLPDERIA